MSSNYRWVVESLDMNGDGLFNIIIPQNICLLGNSCFYKLLLCIMPRISGCIKTDTLFHNFLHALRPFSISGNFECIAHIWLEPTGNRVITDWLNKLRTFSGR